MPKSETVSSASARDSDNDRKQARNPYLSGLRQDVYRFVAENPDVTRKDVSKGLNLGMSSATARIKELIDEGYLFEPPGKRKENSSGVRAKVLRVTDRPEGGSPLDKVRVEIVLTIDCNGGYGAEARVIGASPTSGRTTAIKRQQITVTAPHPDTYRSAAESLKTSDRVTHVSRMEIEQNADDIIDGTAVELTDTP